VLCTGIDDPAKVTPEACFREDLGADSFDLVSQQVKVVGQIANLPGAI